MVSDEGRPVITGGGMPEEEKEDALAAVVPVLLFWRLSLLERTSPSAEAVEGDSIPSRVTTMVGVADV